MANKNKHNNRRRNTQKTIQGFLPSYQNDSHHRERRKDYNNKKRVNKHPILCDDELSDFREEKEEESYMDDGRYNSRHHKTYSQDSRVDDTAHIYHEEEVVRVSGYEPSTNINAQSKSASLYFKPIYSALAYVSDPKLLNSANEQATAIESPKATEDTFGFHFDSAPSTVVSSQPSVHYLQTVPTLQRKKKEEYKGESRESVNSIIQKYLVREKHTKKRKIIPGDDIYISDDDCYIVEKDNVLDRSYAKMAEDYVENAQITMEEMISQPSMLRDPLEHQMREDADYGCDGIGYGFTTQGSAIGACDSDSDSIYHDAAEVIVIDSDSDDDDNNDTEVFSKPIVSERHKAQYYDETITDKMFEINNTMLEFIKSKESRYVFPRNLAMYYAHVRLLGYFYNLRVAMGGHVCKRKLYMKKTSTTNVPISLAHVRMFIHTSLTVLPPNPREKTAKNAHLFNKLPAGFTKETANKKTWITMKPDKSKRESKSARMPSHTKRGMHVGAVVGSNAGPIQANNLGHRMLASMGWSPGDSLGVNSAGITAPLQAVIRDKRKGLGS